MNEAADSLRGFALDRCGKDWRLMSPATRAPFVHEASVHVLRSRWRTSKKETVEDGTEDRIATTPSPDLFAKNTFLHNTEFDFMFYYLSNFL